MNKSAKKVKLELKKASKLENAQVEKKRMDESLLHKLSLLGVHKLSLSYNSLFAEFLGRKKKI